MRRNTRYCLTLLPIAGALVACWHFFSARLDHALGNAPQAPELVAVVTEIPADQPPVTHQLSVAGEVYQLSLDSFVSRSQDGAETLRKLEPAATLDTLVERIKQLSGDDQAFPVLAKGDQQRCLLTSAVTLRLPAGMTPAQAAEQTKMELIEVPEYAPGFAVFRAADALSAWKISEQLLTQGRWPLVELQLAREPQLRALPNDPLFLNQWHLKFQNQSEVLADTDINVESVWNYGGTGVRGAGVRVGIVDDGLQVSHPDFVGNIDTVNDYDFISNDGDPSTATGSVHGTSCAGVVGARGNNNLGVSGVAPEATLVGLRLASSSTTDSQKAQALAHKNDLIAIKSNSWGPRDNGQTLEGPETLTLAALQNAVTTGRQGKGTIFVWAGGNGLETKDNSNYDGYANSIYTIAVGAIDSQMRQAYYSEPGANLHCVTPSGGASDAAGITTTDRTGINGYSNTDYANDFSGTSAACPIAAGAVALMLEKNPNLGWRDVQEILLRSSTQIFPTNPGWATNGAGLRFHHNYGAGLIHAEAAVNRAATWVNRPTSLSPVVSTQSTSASIPDNSSVGVTRSFAINAAMRVEHVTVKVSIAHARRGDLAITLTSPSGMVSQLAEVHDDTHANYSNWTFSSVRHWGESAQGTWTLHVRDGKSLTSGTLNTTELTLFGAAIPAPLVTISSPANQSFFLPQQALQFQLAVGGNVSKVELRQNGTVVATKTSAPYTFTHMPTVANPSYTAIAYDTDVFSTTSAPVTLSLVTPFQQWIGGFTVEDSSPTADPDGDGFTNQQEFFCKTNPGSASSALRVISLEKNLTGTSITLTWQSVSSVSYRIQQSSNLLEWSDLGSVITANTSTTTTTRTIAPATVKFFRICTSP